MRKRTSASRGLIVALLLFTALLASNAQETITIGASDDWARLAYTEQILVVEGRRGFRDAVIEPFSFSPLATTELLLQFDSLPLRDSVGNHTIASQGVSELSTSIQRTGQGALLIDGPEDMLVLEPGPDSWFRPGREWSSFAISFFLYPAALYDGDAILLWEANEGRAGAFRGQELFVGVEGRALKARFTNFFVTPQNEGITVELDGPQLVVPRRWSHHLIRFDGTTGLLEYVVDGTPTDLTYVSESGMQDGSVYYPRIAEYPGDGLVVADGLVGALDELRIDHSFLPDSAAPVYPDMGGILVTDYIDLGSPGAQILAISAIFDEPGMSNVDLYYRLSELRARDPLDGPEWMPLSSLDANGLTSRFVQIRADLFPDPTDGVSPRLSQIGITYEPDLPPAPPSRVFATPGDGEVTIEWSTVLEPDVRGYRVYYGLQSGRYFGNGGPGPSPVDVGGVTSVTLEGLENGRLYFFAIQAYDESGESRHQMSREVAARPSRVHR